MKTPNPAAFRGITASARASMATLPAVADSAAQRRAALLLHSMQDEDRRWLLAALPVEAQGALAPLLAELDALGIERDAQMLEAAIRQVPARAKQVDILQANQGLAGDRREDAAPATWQADEAFLLALDRDGIRLLAGLLRDEPPVLVAHLLQTRPWPWKDAVLLGLDEATRRQVREQCGGDSGAPDAGAALRQAVLRAVAARLRDAVRQPAAPKARWWNRRWRARVQPARAEA